LKVNNSLQKYHIRILRVILTKSGYQEGDSKTVALPAQFITPYTSHSTLDYYTPKEYSEKMHYAGLEKCA